MRDITHRDNKYVLPERERYRQMHTDNDNNKQFNLLKKNKITLSLSRDNCHYTLLGNRFKVMSISKATQRLANYIFVVSKTLASETKKITSLDEKMQSFALVHYLIIFLNDCTILYSILFTKSALRLFKIQSKRNHKTDLTENVYFAIKSSHA